MRIRRKKNLEARIDACKENFIYLIEEEKDARTSEKDSVLERE